MGKYPTVAVVNSSEDTTEMIRVCLQDEGFTSVVLAHVPDIKRGHTDFLEFLGMHDPGVVVWDVAIPYVENWRFLQLLMDLEQMKGRAVVATTTNKRALDQLVGPTDTLEIIGKPYDLDELVKSVKRAAEDLRPTSGAAD